MSQRAAARLAAVPPGRLSEWEAGKRPLSLAAVDALDRALGSDGVLSQLVGASGTASGGLLPPRRQWQHNFQRPNEPVWAWLRPAPTQPLVRAVLSWGPLSIEFERRCDEAGCFVHAPFSVRNPALVVALADPGWVDFGYGTIPSELGVPMVDALGNLTGLQGRRRLQTAIAALLAMASEIRSRAPRGADTLVEAGKKIQLQSLRSQASTEGGGWDVLESSPNTVAVGAIGGREFSGGEYAILRQARLMSQKSAARGASELLAVAPVSEDQLSRFERGSSVRVRWLRARLDTLYQADGYTCLEDADARLLASRDDPARKRYEVAFPEFWVGPIWVSFSCPTEAQEVGHVSLRWWPWQKRLALRPGTTVTTRRATRDSKDLVVDVPNGWTVSGGVGMHPDAIDVNADWVPEDDGAESALWRLYGPIHVLLARQAWKALSGRR